MSSIAPGAAPIAPLPISMIDEHPDNPRTDSWNLVELVDSIRQLGVLTPCIVRPAENGRFQLLAGHRRVRASTELGKPTIPCVIVQPTESDVWAILLTENIQRQNLNLIEEARAYKTLRATGLTILAIANRLGCSEQRVSRRLALLELEPELQAEVVRGDLTIREAWAMVDASRQKRRGPKAGDGRGGRTTKWNEHFNQDHPMADDAGTRCDGEGHEVIKRLGPACAACWEEIIRDDQHEATWLEIFTEDEPSDVPKRESA